MNILEKELLTAFKTIRRAIDEGQLKVHAETQELQFRKCSTIEKGSVPFHKLEYSGMTNFFPAMIYINTAIL